MQNQISFPGTAAMSDLYTLWGTPHSLFTGKVRSYLIKKHVPYQEIVSSEARFLDEVISQVGHRVIPVMQTPEGDIVQDTTAIIDLIEARVAQPDFTPPGPVQRVVANLFDAFGSNYLMPLAMHYRWSYRAQQELFLRSEFARAVPPMEHGQRLETAGKLMARFANFLPGLGVTPAVIPAMEASYAELLAALEQHFQQHPYLLGGRPSIADFGMMAPLYAHLARDPVPAFLMKTTAPSVFRWTERMNSPQIIDTDYPDYPDSFPADDTLPQTLEALLALVFAHWGPGLSADAACFNGWLAGLETAAPGTMVSHDGGRKVHPHVGWISYPWRDVVMERASHPHSLWHFSRTQALADGLSGSDADRIDRLLDRTGGTAMMALRTDRAIARQDNVLVLA
jgi:glutathione S-transferase